MGKRVKPGGIIAGHDYYNSNDPAGLVKCKDVIDAYVKSYNIESFYTYAGDIPRNDPGKVVIDGQAGFGSKNRMFIILTSPRSGSLLLSSLLDSHPNLTCYDEIFLDRDTHYLQFKTKKFEDIDGLFLI